MTEVNRIQLWLLSGPRTNVLYLLKQLEGQEALGEGQKLLKTLFC